MSPLPIAGQLRDAPAATRPLRILHVIASLDPRHGGPSRALPQMCAALAARGHQVTVLTTNGRGSGGLARGSSDPSRHDGVTTYCVALHWPEGYATSLPMVPALLRRIPQADVVHIHSLYLFHTAAAAYLCRRFGVPYVMRPHGTLDPYLRRRHRGRKALYHALVEQRNLDGASAIHYTSADEMLLARPVGIRAPGFVAPLGVDVSEFAVLPPAGTFRAQHPELRDKKLVVFFGRLTPKKGLDLLAEAFGRVAAVDPRAHLVIAGPDDEGHGENVRRWLAQAGVAQRSTILGMLLGQDRLALLADTDVWVLPSYTENFGIAVVEALACGRPVIITDQVNIYRDVLDAEAGLVTACDAGQLSNAITRLLSNREYAGRLGAAGRRLAQSKFDWGATIVTLERAYFDILEARAAQA